MNKTQDNPAKRLAIIVCSVLVVLGCAGAAVSLFGGGGGSPGSGGGSGAVIEEVESKVLSGVDPGNGLYADDILTYSYEDNSDEANFITYKNEGVIGAALGSEHYATISEGEFFVGKNVDTTMGGLFAKNSGDSTGDVYVFETDFKWNGAEYKPGQNWYVKFALGHTLGASTDKSSFLRVYLSGEEGSKYFSLSTQQGKLTNDFILLKDFWYNLRIVYVPGDGGGDYSIYVNNKLIEYGYSSTDVDNTVFDGVYPELRGFLSSGEIVFDNTYINALSEEE